ncbi:MAG: hypothetical protein AAFO69_16980, partial [Bacteroidota bacterium]
LAKEQKAAARLAKKQQKKEEKEAAKLAKKEKKASKKAAKIVKVTVQKEKPVAPKPVAQSAGAAKTKAAPKAVKPAAEVSTKSTQTGQSADLNARMAIAQLGSIATVAELDKFLAGETRATVLRRGKSRKNALTTAG